MRNINRSNNQCKDIIKLVIKIIKISSRQSNIVVGLLYFIPPCAGTGKNYCFWIIYLEAVHILKVSTSYFNFCQVVLKQIQIITGSIKTKKLCVSWKIFKMEFEISTLVKSIVLRCLRANKTAGFSEYSIRFA